MDSAMNNDLVLVTGGTGFLGTHVIAQLLASGYRVRTTVRDLEREGELRGALAGAGVARDVDLALVRAELSEDAGWSDAVAGSRYVVHVASPFPPSLRAWVTTTRTARPVARRTCSRPSAITSALTPMSAPTKKAHSTPSGSMRVRAPLTKDSRPWNRLNRFYEA